MNKLKEEITKAISLINSNTNKIEELKQQTTSTDFARYIIMNEYHPVPPKDEYNKQIISQLQTIQHNTYTQLTQIINKIINICNDIPTLNEYPNALTYHLQHNLLMLQVDLKELNNKLDEINNI